MSQAYVNFRVQPGAKKTEAVGFYAGSIKIKVAAVPEKGAANAALIEYLSRELGLPKDAIQIIRGHFGRNKSVAFEGLTPEEVKRRLIP
ncbi:DUF167 domain-containing protein [Dehalogenimonas alkenigignens]|uniref:UPF0235 protein DEALK_10200 n=1 Tax=Dehalogenimonas alkenigignens TaxID=1217799 RepID=A0A0W0GHY5_9CHLR|nr:DUF167 domain-containing protein [Dehalogenimonas alkenigignens]KTB48175.1 hypothetical protein DEALK_10200 [Dehalogenimonas alkenigignens]PVV84415.1 DUF167 domain-containing protein [Dehalogenimonas alkenigignens]